MDGTNFDKDVINIARELKSAEKRGVVASASAIYDYSISKDQETVNNDLRTALKSLNNTYAEYIQPNIEAAMKTANNAATIANNAVQEISAVNESLSGKASIASVSTLSNDVKELLASNVKITLSANRSYVYKTYPMNIILTSNINTDASNIQDYAIFKDGIRIGDAQSNVNTLNRTVSVTQTVEYIASANITIKGATEQKISNAVSVTTVNPIYKGQQRIDDLASLADSTSEASADVFAATKGIQDNLYSSSTPTNTLVGKTIKFNMTDNYRAWIITTVSTLGATDGGFDFPFYRYSISNLHGTGYYLYVSKNAYSDGEHSLVFNSNGKY